MLQSEQKDIHDRRARISSASLCFKCTPEKFAELCEQEGIGPAPYVGRYKWVLLERLDVLSDSDLKDLIRQSYEMVASKTKAKAKPRKKK